MINDREKVNAADFLEGITKESVLAVVGPTASGKSSLAVRIAKEVDGEIISCDSMQVYRGMDIGTAKATKDEMQGIPHHLIDIVSPNEPFSCADYTVAARAATDDVISRGKMPIFCGGTGLYLESAVFDRTMTSPPSDPLLRQMLEERSIDENYAELLSVDPESAAAIHKNNKKRVIRALEIYRLSGITKSEFDRISSEMPSRYDTRIVVLDCSDREYLYRRIDDRVDKMIADGLALEVRRLSLDKNTTAGQAIGYKELSAALCGECTIEKAIADIKQASRNYAKRQITWFKRYKNALHLDICDPESIDDFVKLLLKKTAR